VVAVPMPAANDYLDRLDALLKGGRNDVELKRIELSSLDIVKKGGSLIAPYSCVLGAVYSHKFDWAKAEIFFNKAIAYADDENIIVYRINKNKGLYQTYQSSKAAKLALELYESNPDNLFVLDEAMAMLKKSLRFDWLENLMQCRQRLDPSRVFNLAYEEKCFVDRLSKNSVSFDDLGVALDVASSVLAEEKLHRQGGNLFINQDGSALFTFFADVTPSEASRLTFEMADKVMDQCNEALIDSVVFNVSPFEETPLAQ